MKRWSDSVVLWLVLLVISPPHHETFETGPDQRKGSKANFVIDVYDEYVMKGNSAVFKCNIPNFVRDHLIITAWIEEPTVRIIQPTVISYHDSNNSRYIMIPTGELYIRQADNTLNQRRYKCRARHRLTGETFTSNTAGKLTVTESHNMISPRISDIRSIVTAVKGETGVLACAAQGWPVPSFHWYRKDFALDKPWIGHNNGADQHQHQRYSMIDGILLIHDVRVEDSGVYVCHVNNSMGEERAESQLKIRAPLSVKLVPSRDSVELGSSILFNCTVTGHPVDKIIWEKDHKPFKEDTSENGVRIVSKELLHIESVKRKHQGLYQCLASNEFEKVQAASHLTIGDDPPELKETFNSQILDPGPSLSLKCVAAGNPLPQITWTLDGFPIPESHRVRFGDFVTKDSLVVSYVNVSSLHVEDGGQYKCKADNGIASTEHSNRINVVGPPLVRSMNNMTVIAGQLLILNCPVAGYPIDSVVWEKDGLRLPGNHRHKPLDNGTLEVHQIEPLIDDGLYTCVASNKEGQTSKSSLYISVKVPPSIANFSFLSGLREGQRASILCTVTSGDPPVKIEWLKDNEPVVHSSGIAITPLSHFSSILFFESVTNDHKGNYTCIASNDAGTASHTANMTIHVPPRWIIEPGDSSVIRGRSLSVDCQAEGYPIPRIRWTKGEGNGPRDFKPIVSSPHLQVYENGSLTIQEAQDSDSGYYLCQASNVVGSVSKVVKITVHVAAHFKTKFTAEMVRKGDNVRLKCDAFGDKPLTVSWTKDKRKIQDNFGSLNSVFNSLGPASNYQETRATGYEITENPTENGLLSSVAINRADRSDSALFTCIASNAFGYDETNIQLIVQEPPDPPQDLQIVEVTSRSVKLAWSPPYSGNSPISTYLVLYRETLGSESKMENMSVPGDEESFAEIRSLKPARTYTVRLIAENRIGQSEVGKSVEVTTEEESPEGPPMKVQVAGVTSKTVKVTWRPPRKDLQNGALKGYYIGYKQVAPSATGGSGDTYIYKTLQISEDFKEEVIIKGLKRFTKYVIVVQAYNNKGASPSSEEAYFQTLEMDPPNTPPMQVTSILSSSVHLSWEPVADDHNPIEGYMLYQRSHSKDASSGNTGGNDAWKEIHLKGHQTFYAAVNLACGTRHQFYLVAYNKAGKGKPSEITTVKTDGSAPVAPLHQSILSSNTTTAVVHLNAWHDGGCPITGYTIRYRLKSPSQADSKSEEWLQAPVDNPSKEADVVISGLIPMKKYRLQVSATNQVASTSADYTFGTYDEVQHEMGIRSSVYNSDLNRIANRALSSSISLQLSDYSIIISVLASILVIVVISFLICVLYRRVQFAAHSARQTESLYASMAGGILNASGNGNGSIGCGNGGGLKSAPESNSNTLRLQDFSKCMRSLENGSETLPKVNCDTLSRKNLCSNLHAIPRSSETEPLYATVKRTPRVPRSEAHIYNYPLIPSSMATVASSSIASNNYNDAISSSAATVSSDTYAAASIGADLSGPNGFCNCEVPKLETETKLIDHGLCPLLLDSL